MRCLLEGGPGLLALAFFVTALAAAASGGQDEKAFKGLGMNLGNLSRLSHAKTRSISPENFTGEKGKAGMAVDGTGQERRPRPRPGLEDLALRHASSPRQTFVMADIKGPGAIQQIWMHARRRLALRHPPLLLGRRDGRPRSSARSATSSPAAGASTPRSPRCPVCVNPGSAFNCYWEMPFRKGFRITLENIADGRFHASTTRSTTR